MRVYKKYRRATNPMVFVLINIKHPSDYFDILVIFVFMNISNVFHSVLSDKTDSGGLYLG